MSIIKKLRKVTIQNKHEESPMEINSMETFDDGPDIHTLFFSTLNMKKVYLEIKKSSELPLNTNFVDILLIIMKKTWSLPETKNFVRMADRDIALKKLNELIKEKGLLYISNQYEKQQKIDEVQETKDELIKLYNKATNKEHFQKLVQSRFPLDSLTALLQAVNSGVLDNDEISNFIKGYVHDQKIKDNPIEINIDEENNLKLDYPVGDSTKTYFIHTDTRNRNVRQWKSSNRYRFDFVAIDDSEYSRSLVYDLIKLKNIIEIKLISSTFSNFSLLTEQNQEAPYLFIDLDEIEGNNYPTFQYGHRVFGRLQNVESRTVLNRFVNLETSGCIRNYSIRQPLDSLASLTINLLDLAGNPFNFGPDGLSITDASLNDPTEITLNMDHDIVSGDRVYITGFVNCIKKEREAINNPSGHIVTVTSPTQFTIPVLITESGVGGFVLVAKRQHSFLWSIKTIPDVLINKFPKQPPSQN